MDPAWQIILAVVSSVLASSGLWAFVMKRAEKNDAKTKLLLGLACDRIVCLGMSYINRGYITKDEYEMIHDYLWVPYEATGGDGTALKIMNQVKSLPIK